jgi:hypothetical protein
MNGTDFTLSLDALKTGQMGISLAYGSFLAEAASHCLRRKNHLNPALLHVTGDVCAPWSLKWCNLSETGDGTWNDLEEAAEYGAYGVAILVALPLTETAQVERSAKGTGIDYWLGDGRDQRGIFQCTARLEVSGIFGGDETKIVARVRKKLTQPKPSDSAGLPAYIVIVHFGRPEARFVKKAVEKMQ